MRLIQDQFLIGVTGIIFNDKQEILVFKHSYRQTVWSLPGGYLKSKEHPQEGLEREIDEESGLVVSVDQQLKTRTDRDSARLDMCYIGKFIGGEFTPSHEVTEHGFFSFDNLPLIPKNQLYLIELAINQKNNLAEKITYKVDRPNSFISRLKFLIGTGSSKK
jgi:ADP-ribose pyrophosphatase YjhB (NUDIX family)